MVRTDWKAWIAAVLKKLWPAWPPLMGFDGVAASEAERRLWLDEEERLLPYLYWPNL